MKIIQPGIKKDFTFTCDVCKCMWTADLKEVYKHVGCNSDLAKRYGFAVLDMPGTLLKVECDCPECGHGAKLAVKEQGGTEC